jgi:hypothetical protein
MSEEITYEKVQATINSAPAEAKALAAVFQQAATEYVASLKMFLDVIGLGGMIPASWVVQPVMTLAQKEFGKISREEWLQLWDDMDALERILTEHPDIKENYERAATGELPNFDDVVAGLDLETPDF